MVVWLVRMGRGEKLPEGSKLLVVVASHRDVLLLDTASSSVWKPRITMFWNRSLCTFAQFSISLWDVLHIAGHVVGSIGVGALASDARHQLVVLVRDVVFGSQLQKPNRFRGRSALCRVGRFAVALISACDFVRDKASPGWSMVPNFWVPLNIRCSR